MPIPILETCRKRKRRPKLFGLHSFAEPGCPINPTGPFRDNIRFFLKQCAEPEDYCVRGMPIWCTLLVHDKSCVLPLYTIEEDVNHSLNPFCDHCRCTGFALSFISLSGFDSFFSCLLPSGFSCFCLGFWLLGLI